jgi:DNA anti-recombination protein RmuC
MEQAELIVTLAVFVATIGGLVLYLRSDSRSARVEQRQAFADIRSSFAELLRLEASRLEQKIDGVEARFSQRIDAVESQLSQRIDAVESQLSQHIDAVENQLSQRIDALETSLSNQMEANRRELLIRLATHHHGDGVFPTSAPLDPDPANPDDGN